MEKLNSSLLLEPTELVAGSKAVVLESPGHWVSDSLALVVLGETLGAWHVVLLFLKYLVDLAAKEDLPVEEQVEGLVRGLDLQTHCAQGVQSEVLLQGGLGKIYEVGNLVEGVNELP